MADSTNKPTELELFPFDETAFDQLDPEQQDIFRAACARAGIVLEPITPEGQSRVRAVFQRMGVCDADGNCLVPDDDIKPAGE